MGAKTFYHNLTRNIINETDLEDFVASSKEGDVIMFSRAGNALLLGMSTTKKDEDYFEYNYVREEFFEKFEEIHSKPHPLKC